jgi:hypothetical protein
LFVFVRLHSGAVVQSVAIRVDHSRSFGQRFVSLRSVMIALAGCSTGASSAVAERRVDLLLSASALLRLSRVLQLRYLRRLQFASRGPPPAPTPRRASSQLQTHR